MVDHIKEFASMLYVARMRQDRKRKEIATRIGVSVNTIAQWETGSCVPPETKIRLIERTYDLDKIEFQEKFARAKKIERADRKALNKLGKKGTAKKSVDQMFGGGIETPEVNRRANSLTISRPGHGHR